MLKSTWDNLTNNSFYLIISIYLLGFFRKYNTRNVLQASPSINKPIYLYLKIILNKNEIHTCLTSWNKIINGHIFFFNFLFSFLNQWVDLILKKPPIPVSIKVHTWHLLIKDNFLIYYKKTCHPMECKTS